MQTLIILYDRSALNVRESPKFYFLISSFSSFLRGQKETQKHTRTDVARTEFYPDASWGGRKSPTIYGPGRQEITDSRELLKLIERIGLYNQS